jgi:hypothetical protein
MPIWWDASLIWRVTWFEEAGDRSTNSLRDEVIALPPFTLAQLAQFNTKHPGP